MNQFYTVRNGQIATKHIFAGSSRIAAKVRTQDQLGNKTDKVYYYHPDHLGSTNYITNNSGAIHEHTEYFPFGESWVSESQNTQANPKLIPYLFTGKELDVETQLYYYGARYYDPRTSVWQSPDPAIIQYINGKSNGGVSNSLNLSLFSYAYQSPVKLIDPDGNKPRYPVGIVITNEKWKENGRVVTAAQYIVGSTGKSSRVNLYVAYIVISKPIGKNGKGGSQVVAKFAVSRDSFLKLGKRYYNQAIDPEDSILGFTNYEGKIFNIDSGKGHYIRLSDPFLKGKNIVTSKIKGRTRGAYTRNGRHYRKDAEFI